MNEIIILGRLTRDPEMNTSGNANEYAKFSVAEDVGYGDKKTTNFWDCIAFNKNAAFVGSFCKKGSAVALTGTVKITRKDDGKKFIDVEVNKIEFQQGASKSEHPVQSSVPTIPATTELADGDSLPF